MKSPRRLVALLLALGAVARAFALEWKQHEVTLTSQPGDEVLRTRFEFKNTGKKIVRILGIRTSCGCTDATINDSDIAPGASSSLDVLFTIGKRTGLQEKEIVVSTDDATEPVKLVLKVKLPEKK